MTAGKRGRPAIKDEIRDLISRKALEKRAMTMTRPKLADELSGLIEEKWGKSPTQETIMKLISKARKNLDNPLDRPFSLGTLVKYPIPPESLLTVLDVWVQYRKEEDTFTIREALWTARLSGVLLEFEKVGDKNRSLANLIPWYAIRERAYEAMGKTTDTTDLDIEVLKLLKLEERKEEDNTLPWVLEYEEYEKGHKNFSKGILKDAQGRERGRISERSEDPYEPKGKKGKEG